MLYDIRLTLRYDYDAPVQGGRHLVRVRPISVPGVQRVIAASVTIDPKPDEELTFPDFFSSSVTAIAFQTPHRSLAVRLSARVNVENLALPEDLSPPASVLREEIARLWSVDRDSPHHFLSGSPNIRLDPEITAYGRESLEQAGSVRSAAMDLCRRIHRDFTYDSEATDVSTTPSDAFALKRGVCQDFAQIMIAGLRGNGIPAGYVSGFLRTIPPKGKPRLEGADAMHAWVRVWCGQDMGWIGFDPTNAMYAGTDHIIIGHGRDYADVSPIVGVLKTHGSHRAKQSVDVVRVD